MLLGWLAVILLGFLAFVMIKVRGRFFFSIFNTPQQRQNETLNTAKVSIVLGFAIAIETVFLAICMACKFVIPSWLDWIMPWGYITVIIVAFILSVTVCKRKTARKKRRKNNIIQKEELS